MADQKCVCRDLGEADVTKLLKDSGVSADKENLKIMIEKLEGKKIHEIIAEGYGKFAAVSAGGASGKFSSPTCFSNASF